MRTYLYFGIITSLILLAFTQVKKEILVVVESTPSYEVTFDEPVFVVISAEHNDKVLTALASSSIDVNSLSNAKVKCGNVLASYSSEQNKQHTSFEVDGVKFKTSDFKTGGAFKMEAITLRSGMPKDIEVSVSKVYEEQDASQVCRKLIVGEI